MAADSLSGISRISKPSLCDLIIDQLQNAIMRGDLPPGTKLPSERELAERLGVSRASVREALKAMSRMGVIDIRPGDGNYVAEVDPAQLARPMSYVIYLNSGNIQNLLELRRIVEVEATGLAAERATEDDIAEIEQVLAETEKRANAMQLDEFLDFDMKFHKRVAAASQNVLLTQVNALLCELLREAGRRVAAIPEGRSAAVAAHRAIMDALKSRNAAKAREHAAAHLAAVKKFSALIAENFERRDCR